MLKARLHIEYQPLLDTARTRTCLGLLWPLLAAVKTIWICTRGAGERGARGARGRSTCKDSQYCRLCFPVEFLYGVLGRAHESSVAWSMHLRMILWRADLTKSLLHMLGSFTQICLLMVAFCLSSIPGTQNVIFLIGDNLGSSKVKYCNPNTSRKLGRTTAKPRQSRM